MKHNISPAINKLLEYNEFTFAIRGDFTLIHSWIDQGCDLEKDIMPAINEMTERNNNITSVSYFAPLVFKKRDNRLAVEQAAKDKAPNYTGSDAIRARGYALKSRKFKMEINQLQKAFLADYEAKHGRIEGT